MLANGKTTKPAGLTKDTGYQFGLRKTFDIKIGQAWHFLTSQEGIHLWLGDVPDFRLEKGFAYRTPDGATGEVRVVNVEVNFRLTWQPGNWPKHPLFKSGLFRLETEPLSAFIKRIYPMQKPGNRCVFDGET